MGLRSLTSQRTAGTAYRILSYVLLKMFAFKVNSLYFSQTECNYQPKPTIMNTEVFTHISYLHVLVAALGYFLLGSIWYSVLFGKKWIAYTGIDINDPEAKKGMATVMITSFLLMVLCSFGLAILEYKLQIGSCIPAIKLGLLTGVCFSLTAISISLVYEKKPFGLHLINGGYNILGSVIAAVILAWWH